jgi:rhodanese-related sulfurtransferase
MQDLTTFISHHPFLCTAIIIVFVLATFVELLRARRNIIHSTPAKVTMLINHENAVIIDIRSQDVYRKGHIIDAVSMTSKELRENGKRVEKFRVRPIVVVCNTGLESQKIAALLLKQGYNIYSLSGGMRAWIEAQMPVVKE